MCDNLCDDLTRASETADGCDDFELNIRVSGIFKVVLAAIDGAVFCSPPPMLN